MITISRKHETRFEIVTCSLQQVNNMSDTIESQVLADLDTIESHVLANKRGRNFATIVYPESAPDNWLDILYRSIVPAFVSPLHDKDVDDNGCIKKAHYHVMVMFEGNKSTEQVKELFSSFGGHKLIRISSIRAMARYLCHLDDQDPKKYKYSVDDVISFGGADYFETINLAADKYNAVGDMMDFIAIEKIYSFAKFCLYCREYRPDWFRLLTDKVSYIVKEFITSFYWADKNGEF